MSRLFELHTLGLLKDKFGETAVLYGKEEVKGHQGVIPDFLIRTPDGQRIIADAKYKKVYQPEEKEGYKIEDIRQLSGYGRDRRILIERLGYPANEVENVVPPCLIFYPRKKLLPMGTPMRLMENVLAEPITPYIKFFKSPVPLPTNNSQP